MEEEGVLRRGPALSLLCTFGAVIGENMLPS